MAGAPFDLTNGVFREAETRQEVRIHEKLGQGKYGTVWKAVMGDEEIAVKTMDKPTQEMHQMAQKEINVLNKLKGHAHVLELKGFARLEGGPTAILMDLLSMDLQDFMYGKNDEKSVQERKQPVSFCVKVAIQLFDALNFIHDKGIVHNDIKPGNICFVKGSTEIIKVVDFGCARNADDATSPFANPGSMAFLSPECVLGDRWNVAKDVWAGAATIAELFMGRHVFDIKDMEEAKQVFCHMNIITARLQRNLFLNKMIEEVSVLHQETSLHGHISKNGKNGASPTQQDLHFATAISNIMLFDQHRRPLAEEALRKMSQFEKTLQ